MLLYYLPTDLLAYLLTYFTVKDFASLVFDVAAVSSGYEIKDTAAFATRVISLMSEVRVAI